MEHALSVATSCSETLVTFYQTERRNIPEISNLHTHRRENLKYRNIFYNRFEIDLLNGDVESYIQSQNRQR
jgi:hypothetical protein